MQTAAFMAASLFPVMVGSYRYVKIVAIGEWVDLSHSASRLALAPTSATATTFVVVALTIVSLPGVVVRVPLRRNAGKSS